MCGVWHLSLRDRLPEIPIPLAAGDLDLILDIQEIFSAVYDDAGYGESLDYRRQPRPMLAVDDAAWATALLAAHRGGAV